LKYFLSKILKLGYHKTQWTLKKSINRPKAVKPRPGVRVEPLEFTSSGGRGGALSRQTKSRFLTFYEGINGRLLPKKLTILWGFEDSRVQVKKNNIQRVKD